MSMKKAKLLRRQLKEQGVDVTQTEYNANRRDVLYVRFTRDDEGELKADLKGDIVLKVRDGIPTELLPTCGRGMYQRIKRSGVAA